MTNAIRGTRSSQKNAISKQRGIRRKEDNVAKNPKSWKDRGLKPKDRVAELDKQYGVGVGAAKEREKLASKDK